jgi:cation diffusion facilitator family transporter
LQRTTRIAAVSILLGLVVLGLKGAAWWVTGSAALYSDALETVVNVLAAAVSLGAIAFAAMPADANHPYGHDKAEFFAAVIEGALIIAAAVEILQHAWGTFLDPHPLAAPWRGVILNAVATVLNGVWAVVLFRVGKRARSPALRGDGVHLMTDVVTSIGILLGVGIVLLTGIELLDPIIAAAVAVYILWSGARLVRESVGGLMDQAPAPAIVARIRALVSEHAAGAIEAHDLRTRHAGKLTFLEFHLVVPGEMQVAEAHEICDRIEAALRGEMEGIVVTIHVEPEGKAKHHGVVVI